MTIDRRPLTARSVGRSAITRGAGFAVTVTLMAGCAASLETPMQSVALETSPPGARCSASIAGRTVAEVARTPASIEVPISRQPLTVSCSRSGYLTAVYTTGADKAAVDGAEDVVDGLMALATQGDFFAKRGYDEIALITLERDPAMPATFDEVEPVVPVAVQSYGTPVKP